MRVYTVCSAASPETLDSFTCFMGREDAPLVVVQERDLAEKLARDFARRHPGETFFVAEGDLIASYLAEPLPVTVRSL